MTVIEPPVLRPLSLSQLLDRAIRLYRQNFLAFVGIIATALIPLGIFDYVIGVLNYPNVARATQQMQSASAAGDSMRLLGAELAAMGGGTGIISTILSFILIQGVATAALVKAVEDSYLGRPISIVDSYRKILGSWASLLIALLVGGLLTLGIYVWMIVPCVGWLTGPGMLIYFSYAIFTLIPITVVIEGQTGFGAIQRAWELTRRRFWWVLGFVVILGILATVIRSGPAALALGLGSYLSQSIMPGADSQTHFAIQTAITQMVTLLLQMVFIPLQITGLILMYFDLRVRTEGFDLALLAASAEGEHAAVTGEPAAPAPLATPAAPPSESRQLVTLNEMGYFVAISIGAVALCAILYGILIAFFMLTLGASRGF